LHTFTNKAAQSISIWAMEVQSSPLIFFARFSRSSASALTLPGLSQFGSTQFSFIEPTLASSGTVTSGLTQISGTTATGFEWNSARDV